MNSDYFTRFRNCLLVLGSGVGALLVWLELTSGWSLAGRLVFFSQFLVLALFFVPFASLACVLLPSLLRAHPSLVLGFTFSGLSVVLYLLGSLSLWRPSVVWSIWTFALSLSVVGFVTGRVRIPWTSFRRRGVFVAVAFPWLLLLCWLGCVGPTNRGVVYPSLECDSSLVHLILPKIYLMNQGLVDAWWTRAPFLPQSQHALSVGALLFSSSLQLRQDLICNFIALFQCIAMAIVLGDFIRRPGASACAFLLLLSYPVVRWSVGTVYLDIPNALYVLLAGYATYRFVEAVLARSPMIPYFAIAAGWFSGMVLTVKHMGALYLLPMFVATCGYLVFGLSTRRISPIQFIRIATLGIAAAVLPVLVFYTRNFLVTGDPFFPFFFFEEPNGYHWDRASYDGFRGAIHVWVKEKTFLSPILAATQIVSDASAFTDTHAFPIGRFLAYQCICIVGSIVLATFIRALRDWRLFIPPLIFLGDLYLWYFSSPVIRYLLPALAVLAVPLLYLMFYGPRWTRALACICLLLGAVTEENRVLLRASPGEPPTDNTALQKFIKDEFPLGASSQWLERNTPTDALVYSYGSSCGWLYLPRPFVGDWFGLWNYADLMQAGKSRDGLLTFFQRAGINYVQVFKDSPLPPWTEIIKTAPECFLEESGATSPSAAVYRFDSDNAACRREQTARDLRSDEIRRLSPRYVGL